MRVSEKKVVLFKKVIQMRDFFLHLPESGLK
jgi:hypothetical protein